MLTVKHAVKFGDKNFTLAIQMLIKGEYLSDLLDNSISITIKNKQMLV